MKGVRFILLLLSLPVISYGSTYTVDQARIAFEIAATNEDKTTELLNNLNDSNLTPILLAYRGATEALMGKFAGVPWSKYTWCKQSMRTFEKAVAAEPENIEIRYLRIAIQIHLPAILNMSGDIESDKACILKNLKFSHNELMNKKIAQYLLANTTCSEQEKTTLFAYR